MAVRLVLCLLQNAGFSAARQVICKAGEAVSVVVLPIQPNAVDGASLQADPVFYPGHSTSMPVIINPEVTVAAFTNKPFRKILFYMPIPES